MATIGVVTEPYDDATIIDALREHQALDDDPARRVYRGVIMDLVSAAAGSGGEPVLLVPAAGASIDADQLIEDAVGPTPDIPVHPYDPGELFFDAVGQVGEPTAVISPANPLVQRTHIDAAAMKMRRHDVVLGPTAAGGVWYHGIHEPREGEWIDPAPGVTGIVEDHLAAERSVDFIPPWPDATTVPGWHGIESLLVAHHAVGREIAPFTHEALRAAGVLTA